MRELVPLAEKLLEDHKDELDDPNDHSPIYSFDNPRTHLRSLSEDMPNFGIVEGQNTFPLPKYSGDIHKAVEHVHGTLTNKMASEHRRVRTEHNLQWYKDKLRAHFWALPASHMQKDVETLPDTFRVIASPASEGGTAGNWAPRKLA